MSTKTLQDLKVLLYEISSSNKSARVFKQKPNSGVFFVENKDKILSEVKKEINHLEKGIGQNVDTTSLNF